MFDSSASTLLTSRFVILLRRALPIALILCFLAPPAFAQGGDDFLTPLSPSKGKTSKPAKTKPKPAPKRAPPAKVVKKGKKPGKAGKEPEATPVATPEPAQNNNNDPLLAPLVPETAKTELLVKAPGAPRGARLLIDDKDMGPLPKNSLEVTPGEHTLTVRRSGYREFSRRITAKEGEVTEVGVQLDAVAGFMSVKADVPGARVLINGEDKGAVPLEGLVLPPGSYDIVVQRKGFRPETKSIAVRAGKDYNIDVSLRPEAVASDEPRAPVLTPSTPVATTGPLTPEPAAVATSTPLTQRWYFWAGVGVAVAAATVGTVVATQPLKPVDVCGGPCDGTINAPSALTPLRF